VAFFSTDSNVVLLFRLYRSVLVTRGHVRGRVSERGVSRLTKRKKDLQNIKLRDVPSVYVLHTCKKKKRFAVARFDRTIIIIIRINSYKRKRELAFRKVFRIKSLNYDLNVRFETKRSAVLTKQISRHYGQRTA